MRRFLVALLLLFPALTMAQPILYATQACGRCDPLTQTGLYTIDPASGAPTLVGDTGESITGLDFHPLTGVLYGTTTRNSANPSSLITIDPGTAAVTVIGPHGVDQHITDLSFAPDGTLYGWAEPGADDVVTIDLLTGAATLVADANVNSGGCAFDMAPDGFLYLFGGYCDWWASEDDPVENAILKIDPATGQVVDYASIVTDAIWNCDTPDYTGAFSAAAHDDAGQLFGFSNAGCDDDEIRYLTTLNLATGVPTLVGTSLDWASGLAFVEGAAEQQPVPTLQRSGLVIALTLFALLGILMVHRRRHA